jgi:hypothetical protein
MPPRRKPPQAANAAPEPKGPVLHPTVGNWKGIVLAFIFALILLGVLWSTGMFRNVFAGPKIPLPRQVVDLTLGMSLDEVMKKYPLMNLGEIFRQYPSLSLEEILKKNPKLRKKLPEMENTLRSFNDDPNFGIATIMPQAGLTGAESVDVLFYLPNKQLYFISANFFGDNAQKLPLQQWAHQYRRWNTNANGVPESLGKDVLLREWKFVDSQTEMTLRDLDNSGKILRWQELRDASNNPAQQAFSKWRLDAGT